jgi:hypothetical protein
VQQRVSEGDNSSAVERTVSYAGGEEEGSRPTRWDIVATFKLKSIICSITSISSFPLPLPLSLEYRQMMGCIANRRYTQ